VEIAVQRSDFPGKAEVNVNLLAIDSNLRHGSSPCLQHKNVPDATHKAVVLVLDPVAPPQFDLSRSICRRFNSAKRRPDPARLLEPIAKQSLHISKRKRRLPLKLRSPALALGAEIVFNKRRPRLPR
jgi:hypothetical protein